MKSYQMIEEDIKKTWQDNKTENFLKAKRINILKLIKKGEKECRQDCVDYLGLWLALYDEAVQFVIQLYQFSLKCHERDDVNKEISRSYIMALGRICKLLLAIRQLIINGLEEATRPIARSLIETISIAIISLGDQTFSQSYSSEEDYDSREFYYKNLAKGKDIRKIKEILEKLGFSNSEKEEFSDRRKVIMGMLSDSTHSAMACSFQAMMIPSLKYPSMFFSGISGHISHHTPNHLLVIIQEIVIFGDIALASIEQEEQAHIYQEARKVSGLESVLVSYFVLQDIFDKYQHDLDLSDKTLQEV